jgi:hypothetical protein
MSDQKPSRLARLFGDPDVKVVRPDGTSVSLSTFLVPTAIFMLAALALLASMMLPYWQMKLTAPQYPKGLYTRVYVNHLEGDVSEIDELNHYLGMPKLDEGGQFERSISALALSVIGLLMLGTTFVHNRWASLFVIPALLWPLAFLGDLSLILYQYGHSIDPKSALGGAIKPITPPNIGQGMIGQFGTIAEAGPGLILAIVASGLLLVGLWYHRKAYKPIVDARKAMKQQGAVSQGSRIS